ncbi:MAG: NAD(P)-dependent oxidoreductase [Roseivirga sp.]|nr:NAD(P)-dependent oxidoreductase [Roseivirga sp.]
MKIGFIGLGIMGSRMAANLQKAGHDLVVYNRTASKAQELVSLGARSAESPAEAARGAEVVITMLSTPDVVKQLTEEFLPVMPKGAIWIDISTVNPSFSREMGKLSAGYQIRFVDAPVAGSKVAAENAELLFLAGGKEEELTDMAPLFDIMGKKTLYLGEMGNGTNVKMLINLMLAQSMATFSEAIALGKGMGLAEGQLLNILTATPVVAPVMGLLKERLLDGNFDVNFPLRWIHKDIMLALDTASELSVPMPSLGQTEALYKNAMDSGMGDLDFSAIYKALT